MSIIYDALKKVEQSGGPILKNKSDKEIVTPKNKGKKYLIYILFLALGLFFANITFSYLIPSLSKVKTVNKTKNTPIQNKLPVQATVEQAIPLPPPAVAVKPEPHLKPTLTLNGIFFSGDESYALINNQIVKVKDKISGAVIKEISSDEVLLDFEGAEIKLTTR
ncbi:MAG: hypothetical protein WC417_07025 [Candidatus Omnitrophota bacterium]